MRKKMWISGFVGVCLLGTFFVRSYGVQAEEAPLTTESIIAFANPELSESLAANTTAVNQPPARRGFGWGRGRFAGTEKGHAVRKLFQGIVGHMMVLRSELDVTETQKGELKKVLFAHKDEVKTAIGSVLDSKKALDKAVSEGESDEALKKSADQFGDSVSQLALEFAKAKKEARKVLTKEQLEKIDATKSNIWKKVDTFRDKMK